MLITIICIMPFLILSASMKWSWFFSFVSFLLCSLKKEVIIFYISYLKKKNLIFVYICVLLLNSAYGVFSWWYFISICHPEVWDLKVIISWGFIFVASLVLEFTDMFLVNFAGFYTTAPSVKWTHWVTVPQYYER